MRQILAELAVDDGLADAQIAERLCRPVADVRQAARILYRQRRTDFCQGFIVLAPHQGEGGGQRENSG
jgi:hypothetical protein